MRSGTHNRKLESSKWLRALEAVNFTPKIFNFKYSWKGSCGTAALATITGLSPDFIDKKMPRTNDHWTDKAVKKFLRKNGFEVTEITVSRVTQNSSHQEEPITSKHVLIVSQEVLMGEGTWAVINEYKRYHNFETEDLHPFEFINNPLWSVYAVSHPKWKNMPPKNYKVRYDRLRDKYVAA